MAIFNYANREITAKIVYYGPAVCGKTTSLQVIHQKIAPNQRGKLLSLATETDRTIFFDLLPLKLGEIKGFKLKFQLYTVPGQVKYNNTRKLVLQGADAIVFVADSQRARRQANIESFKNLQENLLEQGQRLEDLPLVYEYNKRDVESPLSVEELNRDLNSRGLPYFETVASQGRGVMEALEAISKMTLEYLEKRLLGDQKPKVAEIPKPQMEKKIEEPEETVPVASQDIMDLTLEEPALTFSEEELTGLELESDLLPPMDQPQPSPSSSFEDLLASSKPIGYGDNVQIEEAELTTLPLVSDEPLQSQFFDLKEVEAQAFRDLENFLGPLKDSQEDETTFNPPQTSEASTDSLPLEDSSLDFKLEPEYEESGEKLQESSFFGENEDLLDFGIEEKMEDEDLPGVGPGSEEKAGAKDLLEFVREQEEKSEMEDLLGFALEDKEEMPTPLSSEEDFFATQATSQEGRSTRLEELIPEQEKPQDKGLTSSMQQTLESSRQGLTEDSSISRIPNLAESPRVLEEIIPASFSETPPIEENPYINLLKFSKSLYQKGQEYLSRETDLNLSLALFSYYLAVETALKAVALKFETCNPEIASMPLLLDSIEEETGKSLMGRKFIEERVIKAKNDLQLKLLFPDLETCQLIAQTAGRFLEALARDFLDTDFSQLPPISYKPS
ncbi:MAG TPA: ADP-ribosylation factor-like protein [Candidatus Limnocylindrales bacterium]|nr:ADP-ribosylation factor-like protein [Candidatus Limnocylindrales bacterium]